MSVPIESLYATSYWWLILNDILSCTVSKSSQIIVQILDGKRSLCVFEPPPPWGLGATHTVSYSHCAKLVEDFLFMLIELFFVRCYSWGTTSEYWLEISIFEADGSVSANFHQPLLHVQTGQWIHYNLAANSFHTKNFVADFLPEKFTFRQKMAILHFWASLWGLRDNVNCSS